MKMARFLRFQAVSVAGSSMAPTFNQGDWLLFRSLRNQSHPDFAKNLLGQVVLIQRESQAGKDFIQIKRVTKVSSDGIWVEGDNANESTDSRTWGNLKPQEIKAIFVLRYKKA